MIDRCDCECFRPVGAPDPKTEAVLDLGGPDGGRYWRVVSDHALDHPDVFAAAVHARATGSVGCTYNDAKVERVSGPNEARSADGQLRDYTESYYVEQRGDVWVIATRYGSVVTTVENRSQGEALIARWARNRHGS